jgi:hypothetical protein
LFNKNILIPNVAEKNILILVEEKKKFDSEFLSYNLMWNSEKKNCALRDKKNKYILTLVLSERDFVVKNICTFDLDILTKVFLE